MYTGLHRIAAGCSLPNGVQRVLEVGKIFLYVVGGLFLLANVLGSIWMVCMVIYAMVDSYQQEHRNSRN